MLVLREWSSNMCARMNSLPAPHARRRNPYVFDGVAENAGLAGGLVNHARPTNCARDVYTGPEWSCKLRRVATGAAASSTFVRWYSSCIAALA